MGPVTRKTHDPMTPSSDEGDEGDSDESDAPTEPDADADVLAQIRAVCLGFPEVEEAELQGRPLFRVRRRRFAIVNGATAPARPRWEGFGRSLHVLTEPTEQEALRHDPRFEPSPHHGDRGWMALRLDRAPVDRDEIAELLEAGYRRAAGRELVECLHRRRSDH